MKRLFLIATLIIGASFAAYAQSPVVTRPQGVTTGDYSGSIASTNTFQEVFPASTATTGRLDCIIQNNSASAKMYIHFGSNPSAITPDSLNLAAGAIFRCANGGTVIKDRISITGTSGDLFFATQQ